MDSRNIKHLANGVSLPSVKSTRNARKSRSEVKTRRLDRSKRPGRTFLLRRAGARTAVSTPTLLSALRFVENRDRFQLGHGVQRHARDGFVARRVGKETCARGSCQQRVNNP